MASLKTNCPTGCPYNCSDRCIAAECKQTLATKPYQYEDYSIKINPLDDFVKWLKMKEKQQPHILLLMSVDDIANAVEKYKIEKNILDNSI